MGFPAKEVIGFPVRGFKSRRLRQLATPRLVRGVRVVWGGFSVRIARWASFGAAEGDMRS